MPPYPKTTISVTVLSLRRTLQLCSFILLATLLSGCPRNVAQDRKAAKTFPDPARLAEQDRQVRTVILFTLVPVGLAFVYFVFIFYRARRESFFKQQEMEFKLTMAELEVRALRAQVNPHFIFNCLNSIHHYMRGNDGKVAGDYLLKFSQLIRYALETSSFRMVALAEDVNALRAYLELERLRMHHSFTFEINMEDIDPLAVYIPPMMIQPFIENAIWHGLKHRESEGRIELTFRLADGLLQCVVEDNGLHQKREEVPVMPGIRKTSMGMMLIRERLNAINRLFNAQASFRVEDRTQDSPPAQGTRIVLTLPFETD